ncbi:hypothetical protein N4R57_13030 [Rhodobacteraceae bacterium D3-12]|nr:hypothetical protein N4R57_13030 [Rhodobacteraceae bacterium D3-12]
MDVRGKLIIGLGAAAMLLASCGAVDRLKPKKGLFFDGHQFRAKAQKVEDDRHEFIVTVSRASQSAEGAREAGRHEANGYCIKNYGKSDIDWAAGLGPDDDNIATRIADDKLTLRGRCQGW